MSRLIYRDLRPHRKQSWPDLESCVKDLLVPDRGICTQSTEIALGQEIEHLRECLARYMVRRGLNMNDLDEIFYTDMMVEEVGELEGGFIGDHLRD